jgi:hypothetical protein
MAQGARFSTIEMKSPFDENPGLGPLQKIKSFTVHADARPVFEANYYDMRSFINDLCRPRLDRY